MPKKILISLILLACFLFSFSQTESGINQVVPPSPTAVQFQRYGEYPVTHYTGLPSISIPIYTIEEGDITVPITLDYHASGMRPDDVSGAVGLGWTLNTGGSISRTINGLPDGDVGFWIPPQKARDIQYWNYDRAQELKRLNEGLYDHEYDVYSYNFLGKSGKYLWVEGKFQPFFLQASDMKWDDGGLVDENGIKYWFNDAFEYQQYTDWNGFERSAVSTMHLSGIVSAKHPANGVGYSYQQGPSYIIDKNVYQYILDDFYDNPNYNCNFFPYTTCNAGGLSQPGNLIKYYTYLPSVISFSSGKVVFNLNASTKILNSIEVFDKNNNLIKKVEFNIAPFPTNHAVNNFSNYKLQSLVFKDVTNVNVQKYSFNYYNEGLVDAKPEAFNSTAGKDHWGFYNGTTHTVGIPPFSTFLTKEGGFPYAKPIGGNAIKTPSEEFTKTYILNKITYPTGGYTEFDYEANMAHGNIPVGGLRIKTISNYSDANQLAYQKKYTYALPFVEVSPSIEYYINGMAGYATFAEGVSAFRRIYMSEQASIDFSPQGSPVVYPLITETDGNSEIHYAYDVGNAYTYGQLDFPAAQISSSPPNDYYFKKYTNYYKPWNYGNLLGKWANVGEMNDEYEYEEFITDTARDFLMTRWVVPHITGNNYPNFDAIYPLSTGNNVFNYTDHYYLSGGKRIKKAISHYSKDGLQLTKVKEYFYDNPDRPTIATRIATNNSKGEIITTYLKYPFDLATTSPYNDMTEKNIISPVIEQTQVNTTLNVELSKSKTNYCSWQNNALILPASIENSVLGNPYQTEVSIENYDEKGNMLQLTGKDGIITSYIWGYDNNTCCKIVGKSYNDAIIQSGINLSIVSAPANDNALRTELNKLRAISGAFVSTYTYKQLIGITSETDPTGNTQYYEYDAFGRLSLIRDKDQNILKRFCYNYQGQATTCSNDPVGVSNWQPTGETRCQTCKTNSNFFTNAIERKEIDNNPNSPTYTNIRWVVAGYGGACSYNGWQNTNTPVQCAKVDGVNNGQILQEQKNIDPCSGDYGSIRWVVVGTNTNACPIPSIFYSDDLSGNYSKSTCSWPYLSGDPVYVSVPQAMFSSTVSPSDANSKAMAYAFHVADSLGSCILPPVTLNFYNGLFNDKFNIELNDSNDQLLYSFQVTGSGSYILGDIPAGIYNVRIYPFAGYDNYTYSAGCGFSAYGNDVMIYNVTLDHSCNNLSVY